MRYEHKKVDEALRYYWSTPELAPLREELKHFAETVYPSKGDEEALCQEEADSQLLGDPQSYWECWNYFRAILSCPEVNTDYWDGGEPFRIDDWEKYLQVQRVRRVAKAGAI